jgi:hypothetical protein
MYSVLLELTEMDMIQSFAEIVHITTMLVANLSLVKTNKLLVVLTKPDSLGKLFVQIVYKVVPNVVLINLILVESEVSNVDTDNTINQLIPLVPTA